MMSRRDWITVGILALAGCDNAAGDEVPRVPDGRFPAVVADHLPSPLTAKNLGALEAIAAGMLVRRGPCLVLGMGPQEPVIVWEKGTTINRTAEGAIAIVPRSGIRITEGDTLHGAGGSLPLGQPISDFTNEPVPDECAVGDAVFVHSVEQVEAAPSKPVDDRRPPPPPPSPSLSFLDAVMNSDPGGGTVIATIRGIDDPREALFIHLLATIRNGEGHQNSPACLREIDDQMLVRLSGKFDDLYRTGDCRWNDGGVVLRRDERKAVFVSANLDCDGRTLCAAEGARVYGNVGGEGQGYILRPTIGGWEMRTVGVSWMS